MNYSKFHFLLLTLMLISVVACKKNEEKDPGDQHNHPPAFNGPALRFDNLAVGQGARFIGLNGEQYSSSGVNIFEYTDDTLQLEIIAENANGFLVKESLYYTGEVNEWLSPDKDSIYQFYIKIVDDTLRFGAAGSSYLYSRIFGYSTSKQGLPLANFSNQTIEIDGWKTKLGYCECRQSGYTENYTLFGENYPFLNVLVENAPMSFDGNGETFVYSKTAGIVRASTYSWWTSTGIGWDLLP